MVEILHQGKFSSKPHRHSSAVKFPRFPFANQVRPNPCHQLVAFGTNFSLEGFCQFLDILYREAGLYTVPTAYLYLKMNTDEIYIQRKQQIHEITFAKNLPLVKTYCYTVIYPCEH